MKRGRPKGRSRDTKSYGPLGDLIRTYRLKRQLGLLDVAKACRCSVQFISNIEHGRAPLPWDKAQLLARYLEIPVEELQAANLAVRSDFQSFMGNGSSSQKRIIGKRSTALADAASLVAMTAKDSQLRSLLELYHTASEPSRKRFVETARRALNV